MSFVSFIIAKLNCKSHKWKRNSRQLTFLYQPNVVTGGRASARHFRVTLSPSALVIFRLGSSFAKWTETVGGSVKNLCKRARGEWRKESLWLLELMLMKKGGKLAELGERIHTCHTYPSLILKCPIREPWICGSTRQLSAVVLRRNP